MTKRLGHESCITQIALKSKEINILDVLIKQKIRERNENLKCYTSKTNYFFSATLFQGTPENSFDVKPLEQSISIKFLTNFLLEYD